MICDLKHIADPLEGKDWECPSCREGKLYIDESLNDDCEKVHADDVLICDKCRHTVTAKRYFAQVRKTLNLVPCPCCKGTGFVKGGK